jgi:methylenetetrahydrofolate dehydrogenase (NADP+)/methenyltetrahydrofolate cyclohydrolase
MVVIDVGINSVQVPGPDGVMVRRTVGDVDFDAVSPIVRAISPVPGGVGPLTVAMLLKNTIEAARKQRRLRGQN